MFAQKFSDLFMPEMEAVTHDKPLDNYKSDVVFSDNVHETSERQKIIDIESVRKNNQSMKKISNIYYLFLCLLFLFTACVQKIVELDDPE